MEGGLIEGSFQIFPTKGELIREELKRGRARDGNIR